MWVDTAETRASVFTNVSCLSFQVRERTCQSIYIHVMCEHTYYSLIKPIMMLFLFSREEAAAVSQEEADSPGESLAFEIFLDCFETLSDRQLLYWQ